MAHTFQRTANQEYFDALVRHQIGLLRVAGNTRNRIFELLDATEEDIAGKIRRRLAGRSGLNTPADVRRLTLLLKSIRATRLRSWKQIDELFVKELIDLANAEVAFLDGALKTVVPVVLETTLPSTALLRSLATTKPFEGKTLRRWSRSMRDGDLRRIEESIKIGMVQGESSAAIARRVVGTRVARGRNGITQVTRNGAAGIVRTAVNAISNQAKRAYYQTNSDIFRRELYVATLDGRTTLICSSLDGEIFKLAEGPFPPIHFNCRSLRMGIIDDVFIGMRPARAFTERTLVREFSAKRGFEAPTTRAGLPFGTKGAYDSFSQRRIRELTGRVPARQTYQEWLTTQPRLFQDDVLGPTRGKLFRAGGLRLDRFVNRSGDALPLDQLARLNRRAFVAAGLDPEDFL